jgi:hypothetical protein
MGPRPVFSVFHSDPAVIMILRKAANMEELV